MKMLSLEDVLYSEFWVIAFLMESVITAREVEKQAAVKTQNEFSSKWNMK